MKVLKFGKKIKYFLHLFKSSFCFLKDDLSFFKDIANKNYKNFIYF